MYLEKLGVAMCVNFTSISMQWLVLVGRGRWPLLVPPSEMDQYLRPYKLIVRLVCAGRCRNVLDTLPLRLDVIF